MTVFERCLILQPGALRKKHQDCHHGRTGRLLGRWTSRDFDYCAVQIDGMGRREYRLFKPGWVYCL